MKKRIAFQSGQVSERGTEVALFDYALANERVLGNESICLFPRDRILSETANERFRRLFEVRYYDSPADWDGLLDELRVDGFYSIRYGGGFGKDELPRDIPAFIHCVFDTRRPYGALCASISPYLNKKFHTALPVMPHIVEKKSDAQDDLREALGINRQATVFGCYGGRESFSISCAQRAVAEAAVARPDYFFLFMNIDPFCEDPHVRFLPGNTDADDKQRFINSCDAMLHARSDGETFGLSVAEFFISGKPIITYMPRFDPRRRYDRAHLDMLDGACSVYSSKRELLQILLTFQKRELDESLIDVTYLKPYSRERVMGIFDELFVSRL